MGGGGGGGANSSAVSLFLFNPSSQTVQHFYKEHNQTLQRDCQITSRKWRPIWLKHRNIFKAG